jgi:cytochrome c biogenesis protein CcdA
MGIISELQPAVKKETKNVAIYTVVGVVLMWIVFGVCHGVMPEKIPFDYTVVLGGIGGGVIAVLNFFLMGLTVQKVASTQDEDTARARMKASYSQRMMLQTLWIVAAIAIPCFQFVAGLLPLLFPGFGIKLTGILNRNKS